MENNTLKLKGTKFKKQSKIFIFKNKNKFLGLILFGVLILILVLIYDLLKYLFTDFGAMMICALSVISFIRFIAVVSTFPGSYWFFKRQMQLDFNRDYCSRLNLSTERFIKSIQSDLENGKLNNNKYRLPFG